MPMTRRFIPRSKPARALFAVLVLLLVLLGGLHVSGSGHEGFDPEAGSAWAPLLSLLFLVLIGLVGTARRLSPPVLATPMTTYMLGRTSCGSSLTTASTNAPLRC